MGDVAMSEAATARLEWIEIPTCPFPPYNPYPDFRRDRYRTSYPYAKQSDLVDKPAPARHRAVVLENRYVRATVLPDLGGRLFSLFDKVAGQETFMVPPTLKFQNVSNRGAWLAGGIEFNFGQRGHSLLTVAPIGWAIREEPDGTAAVWIGSVTRPTENRYALRIGLKPDRAALDLDIHTMAPPELPGLMYWWSNAGVEVTPHSRFFYFGLHADAMHSRHGWPIADGKDFSWYRNRFLEADMFLLEPQRDYLGFYDFGRHHGLAQTADRFKAPGQKYFTWGTHHQGRFWDAMFSDSGQTYAEIQRGRLPTQGLTEPIPPMSGADWDESWLPIRGTEGFSAVEGDLVLSVNAEGGEAVIRLQGVRPLAGLRMEARSGEQVLGAWDIERTDPETTIVQRVALGEGQRCDRVTVADPEGRTLLDWTEFVFRDEDWYSEAREHPRLRRPPETGAADDELFHQSERARFSVWPDVPDYVRRIQDALLARDPEHTGILKARAEMHLFRGDYDLAAADAQAARRRDACNPDLLLLEGWARLYAGRPDEAIDAFRSAARYQTHRRGALFGLACAALSAGQTDRALDAADELHRAEPADPWARLAWVMALRLAGRVKQAREALPVLLAAEPLWTRAHAEAFLLDVPVEIADGSRRFADDSVTAAIPYLHLGLWSDAVRLLAIDEQNEPFSPAVRLAHLAYVQLKSGDAAAAEETMGLLAGAAAEYAHPWATASIEVMRELHRAFPDEPMSLLMLGHLLAARDRNDLAEAAWRKTTELGMDHPVLLRNLAVMAAGRNDHDEAMKLYRQAWQAAGDDRYLFCEIDRYLAERGLHDERLELYGELPKASQARSMVAMRRVLMLLDAGMWEAALRELSTRRFLRGEYEKTIHYNWVEAVVGCALAPIAAGEWDKAREVLHRGLEYPRNLNIGRHGATPNESMVNYLLGVVADLAGDAAEAARRYTLAAEETHTEGTPFHAYEMLAWLARGNRVRGLEIAHRIEQMARGEIDMPNWLRWWYPESILKLSHGLVQLARGRTAEARAIWQAVLAAEPDSRWVKLHLAMPPALLERMARLPDWPDSRPTV